MIPYRLIADHEAVLTEKRKVIAGEIELVSAGERPGFIFKIMILTLERRLGG